MLHVACQNLKLLDHFLFFLCLFTCLSDYLYLTVSFNQNGLIRSFLTINDQLSLFCFASWARDGLLLFKFFVIVVV